MKDFMYLNLNAEIFVKLKTEGIKLYKNRFLKYQIEPPNNLSIERYTKFQVWEFMEIFGPVTCIGFQDYYENTIKINKNDLKETKND